MTANDAMSGLKRLNRTSLSDRAYEEIRTALKRSRLKPGQKLVLRALAAELGISATPVREALLRLVADQVLELDERGTVWVPAIDLGRYLEIRGLRVLLEGEAGEIAAERAKPADIDRLARLHQGMCKAASEADLQRALEANERFHLELARLAALPLHLRFIEQLWSQAGPMLDTLQARLDNLRRADHEHLAVIQGLRDRDGPAVRRAIVRDIVAGGQPVLEHLERTGRGPVAATASLDA